MTTYVVGYGRSLTGQVSGGEWDERRLILNQHNKIAACFAHWNDGLTWEATGIFGWFEERLKDGGSFDGCHTMEDVRQRYSTLDAIFDQVRTEGRLRTVAEVEDRVFREYRGVYIHIGRDLVPIFGNGGCHRLAMAIVLDLPPIPAQLGLVHDEALIDWQRYYGAVE